MSYDEAKLLVLEHVRCKPCTGCGKRVVLGKYDLKVLLCWDCVGVLKETLVGEGLVRRYETDN